MKPNVTPKITLKSLTKLAIACENTPEELRDFLATHIEAVAALFGVTPARMAEAISVKMCSDENLCSNLIGTCRGDQHCERERGAERAKKSAAAAAAAERIYVDGTLSVEAMGHKDLSAVKWLVFVTPSHTVRVSAHMARDFARAKRCKGATASLQVTPQGERHLEIKWATGRARLSSVGGFNEDEAVYVHMDAVAVKEAA